MENTKSKRIASLDILKGMVIVFMALDHTRDYFHYDSFFMDPSDPESSNYLLFLTRWITHYCAPAFSFLAGISAYLVGMRKTKKELSGFLFKRGLWLIFIELTIVMFAWRFNLTPSSIGLLVIWSLGVSMIFLAGFIHLSMRAILVISLILIFGHNLLDNIHFEDNVWWGILHEFRNYEINGITLRVVYPLIPWIGVMAFGYYIGKYYDRAVDPEKRRALFRKIGFGAIAGFFLIRFINAYGNADPWVAYASFEKVFISFMDPLKYPPSLTYLLMTLGPVFLFLAYSENWRGRVASFFTVFGRVPFFFYIIHIYVIHIFAAILAELTGFGFEAMILDGFVSLQPQLDGYGVNLFWVYVVWFVILLLLYPLCKKFGDYKLAHKEKAWLSYL